MGGGQQLGLSAKGGGKLLKGIQDVGVWMGVASLNSAQSSLCF